MKVIYIECNEEEMRANRTILDNLAEVFSSITRSFAGVDVTPEMLAKAYVDEETKAYMDEEGEEDEESEEV